MSNHEDIYSNLIRSEHTHIRNLINDAIPLLTEPVVDLGLYREFSKRIEQSATSLRQLVKHANRRQCLSNPFNPHTVSGTANVEIKTFPGPSVEEVPAGEKLKSSASGSSISLRAWNPLDKWNQRIVQMRELLWNDLTGEPQWAYGFLHLQGGTVIDVLIGNQDSHGNMDPHQVIFSQRLDEPTSPGIGWTPEQIKEWSSFMTRQLRIMHRDEDKLFFGGWLYQVEITASGCNGLNPDHEEDLEAAMAEEREESPNLDIPHNELGH